MDISVTTDEDPNDESESADDDSSHPPAPCTPTI